MNWYKKAQEIIENPENIYYTDIGHEDEKSIGFYDKPNYMWIFHNGELKVKEENEDTPGHYEAFGEDSYNAPYSGRYETDTGRVSIYSVGGITDLRRVPDFLIFALKQKFRNIKEIYRFTG